MLRCFKRPSGLLALALLLPVAATAMTLAPDEASAKRFRFSKHGSSEGSTHAGSGAHKPHENGHDEAASTAGEEGSSFSLRPKLRLSTTEEDEKGATSADAKEAGEDVPAKTADETAAPMTPPTEQSAEGQSPASDEPAQSAEGSTMPKPSEPAGVAQQGDGGPEKDAVATAAASAPAPAKVTAKPVVKHPLAAALPGMDVVVCEGGCTNASETAQVVYMQPTTEKTGVVSEVKPTSSAPAEAAIVCLGGCYSVPKSYHAAFAQEQHGSIVPLNAQPSQMGSGEWLRRIDDKRDNSSKN